MSSASVPAPNASPEQIEKETSRLEAFSDGVFAIAITLLALELKIPHLGEEATGRALLDAMLAQWPSYLALVTSFFTILIMWINHHGMFCHLRSISTPLMMANGLLLMLITIVPFPTALVSDYLGKPAGPMACAMYAGIFILIAMSFNLLWWTARSDDDLLHPESAKADRDRITRAYAIGIPAYVLALGVAFVNEYVSIGICAGLWIFYIALMRRL